MLIAGQKDMQQMDRFTIETLGLPGVVLMENAGARVVEEIMASTSNKQPRVVILAGRGNNGGDGFVIARRLADLGVQPLLCLLVDPESVKGDAKVHLDVYIKRELPIFYYKEQTRRELDAQLDQADIIVDAILGTGIKGAVREPFTEVIEAVNEFAGEKMIISVDIPSGLNSDTGDVENVAVKATKTVTFVFPKKGFFLKAGPQFIGNWKAVDISVPHGIADDLNLQLPVLITEELAKSFVPIRPSSGHKGTFGHALVVGGSTSFVGAPIFSAKAALCSGAGLVTLAVPESIYQMAATLNPESLFLPLPDQNGHISPKSADMILENQEKFLSVAIGPGLSRFPNGETWIRQLITGLSKQTLVIDADGLYLLRHELKRIKEYEGDVIFTPHPGEMAYLMSKTISEIENNRLEVARTFAVQYQIYLLLKGHRSIIATPTGDLYVNPYGNDALGKGGSGDVLTGMITSFLAQGAKPKEALVAASFLHAKAGEEKGKSISNYGVTPFDLIEEVRRLLS